MVEADQGSWCWGTPVDCLIYIANFFLNWTTYLGDRRVERLGCE